MLDDTLIARLTEWRHHLHAHPELSFEESATAAFVSDRLTEMGIPHETGIGGHGVVATLRRPGSNRAVGLRADMDALPITEATELPYASTRSGVMHACGHDGHTAALLGAAAVLAESEDWQGRIHLIFQPAEERGGGAKAMLADGLLERFPMDRIFAFHNWPGIAAGTVVATPGPVFAAGGPFAIRLTGTAGHAAAPHTTRDVIAASGSLITALQSVVSRNIDPLSPAVVTIAKIHGGTVTNQIPAEVLLEGTIRTFSRPLRAEIAAHITRIAEGVAAAYGVAATVNVDPGGQVCINAPAETEIAAEATLAIGAELRRDVPPVMGGDDMSYLLQAVPGCYVRIGAGPARPDGELHGPGFDFNDAILPVATGWLARVAQLALAAKAGPKKA